MQSSRAKCSSRKHGWFIRRRVTPLRALALAAAPALILLAGCGGGSSSASSGTFSISPGTASIDTNCTGCNSTSSAGTAVEHLLATDNSGSAVGVTWSVPSPATTYGSINSSGQYTPPGYLTADSLQVTVTAELTSSPSQTATATITVTPGFLEPLSPENAALGANGTLTLTGYIAEAGGKRESLTRFQARQADRPAGRARWARPTARAAPRPLLSAA